MKVLESEILCGMLHLAIDEDNNEIITDIKTEKNCITPEIIKTIINQYGLEDTKEIISTMYCKGCASNLYYTTCGRIIPRLLSNLLNI